MEGFRKILSWELFRGIKEGKITSLIFDEDVFQNVEEGELVEFCSGEDTVKMYFLSSKIVPFQDITDKDAKACGFLNKDLLAYYLIEKYQMTSFFLGKYPYFFDKKLFCIVKIGEFPNDSSNKKVTISNVTYDFDYYNVEYDDKPWRVYNERV